MAYGKKIILCPNVNRDTGFKLTRSVIEILKKHGRDFAVCPLFDDDINSDVPPPGMKTAELEEELPFAEMIITFGGDGTILRAARAAAGYEAAILGINAGGKGFIAELEADEIGIVESAAAGVYEIENRMMLDAEVFRDEKIVCQDYALNDIVIRGYNKIISLKLFGDGNIIYELSGDGVVVATPTGSTAYSMAAGGPIVEPSAQNIIISPICAHLLEAKPFVLASDRCVSVEIGYKKQNYAFMSADGCERVEINSGDTIIIRKSARYSRMVRLSEKSFYRKVSEKLGEKL
jgi:NAD+ kinase